MTLSTINVHNLNIIRKKDALQLNHGILVVLSTKKTWNERRNTRCFVNTPYRSLVIATGRKFQLESLLYSPGHTINFFVNF